MRMSCRLESNKTSLNKLIILIVVTLDEPSDIDGDRQCNKTHVTQMMTFTAITRYSSGPRRTRAHLNLMSVLRLLVATLIYG